MTELWSGYVEGRDNMLPWGATTNQQPGEYGLKLLVPGNELDSADSYAGVDETPVFTTTTVVPECVHKSYLQLPSTEQYGQPGALLLTDGSIYVYKMFAGGGPFGAVLTRWFVAPSAGWVTISVPVRVHANPHPNGDDSPGAAVWRMRVDHQPVEGWWTFGDGFNDREWVWSMWTMQVAAGQRVAVSLQCESRAEAGIDFFTDLSAWSAELTPDDELLVEPVDYVVNVNLVPQDATLAEIAAVTALVHDGRETVLQSHDDALRLVRGGLDGSRMTVWAPERWGGDAFMEYLAAQWPGGLIEMAEIPTNGSGETDPEEPEPEPTPEPGETWEPTSFIPTGTKLGWHAIGNCGLPELYGTDLMAPSIKLVQAVGDISIMPAQYRVVRLIDWPGYSSLEGFSYTQNPESQAEARIANLATILAPYAGHFGFVEYVNEQDIAGLSYAEAMGRFAKRAAEVAPSWMHLLHFSFGPGNPSDLGFWAPIAATGVFETIAARGDGIALHSYHDHRVPSDIEWLLLRHRYLYNTYILPEHLDIPLFITECGPWEHLLNDKTFSLQEWCRVTDDYLAQDPYVAGAHLYTVSDVAGWATFNTAFKALYPWFKQYVASVAGRVNG